MKKAEIKIRFYTELLKIFWAVLVVLTGANVSFLLNLDSTMKLILLIIGVFFETVVWLLIVDYNKQITELLEQLED